MREIGEELRRKREELGLDLSDVQAATRIRLRYLQALEEGRPEAIPGDVFVKGFLRCYGDFLGLDGFALVERYKAAAASSPTASTAEVRSAVTDEASAAATGAGAAGTRTVKEPVLRRSRATGVRYGETRRRIGGGLVRMAVFVFIGLLLYAAYHYEKGGKWEGSKTAGVEDKAETAEGDGLSKQREESPKKNAAGQQPPGETAAGDTAMASEHSQPETVMVTRVVYGTRVTYSVGSDSLKVEARTVDPCWLRVVADGRLVYEGKLMPETPVEWSASQGIAIRAGNPPALRLVVNGRPLDPLQIFVPVDISITIARPSGEAYAGPQVAHIN